MVHENTSLNYLMVMPRFINNQGEEYLFPLGIPYVSAALKAGGFNIRTLNLNHVKDPYIALESIIKEKNIDVVLSGGLSTEFEQVKIVFEIARKCNGGIINVCGGGMISGDPEAAMEALEVVDFGIIGEGEVTSCELCACLENKNNPEDVAGIIFSVNGKWERTAFRADIENIDDLAYPDYEGFGLKYYLENNASTLLDVDGVSKALSILCSRSCPYNCTFCFHTVGKKYRQRSMDSIFGELDHLMENYEFDFLFVLDELFASSQDRVDEFCDRIVRYGINWSASFRVDGITDSLVKRLKAANCTSVCLGLESADNTVLKSMRKNITVEQIGRALKIIRDNGLSPVGNFIFGDIAETPETVKNTLQWWKEHQEFTISLKMIRTLPGSVLYKYAIENGIITDRVQFLKDGCPYVNVSGLSDAEMKELANTISVLDMEKIQEIEFSDVVLSDEPGSVNFGWTCPQCKNASSARQVRLFSLSFATCPECAFKTLPPVADEIIENIDSNLKRILAGKKVALWGMADYAVEFLSKSRVVRDENVFLIDISQFKQGNYIVDKEVHSPDVIAEQGIGVVIPLVPVFSNIISSYMRERYPETEMLSIYDLCGLAKEGTQ